MNKIFFILTLICIFPYTIFSQSNDLQVGGTFNQQRQAQGGFYDYSEPSVINIKVSIWGLVKYPGKFIIPAYSSINDLISYAGGPTPDAFMDELRLIRTNPDSSKTIINLNYKDVLFDNKINSMEKPVTLQAGDILLASGSPRFYLKDYISIFLSVVSVLISFIILLRQK